MNENVILPTPPQPNVYGPITPGQMFERTAALLRENPRLFFGIVAVVIGVEIVVGAVLGGSGFALRRSALDAAPMMKGLILLPLIALGGFLVYIFVQIIQGALFFATQARLAGISTSVGEACRMAAIKAGRLVGISVLVALRILGYILLLDFAAGILLAIAAVAFGGFSHMTGQIPFHFGRGTSLGIGVSFAFCLLLVFALYIAALFWLVIRYALAIPAALAENLSVTEAIRRSISLTRGSKGRLYALFLVIAGVWILITAVTLPLQLMAAHAGSGHYALTAGIAAGLSLVAAVAKILIGWVLMAFAGVATTLCYYDLRVRKEGFGVGVAVPVQELPPVPRPLPNEPIEGLPIS
jgi:hypothetical protein